MSKENGLILAGVFASEHIDKSGECIKISGMDISELNSGNAILNAEHASGSFENYLGRIVEAKKIFKEEDCKTEHERKCFEECNRQPLIYGKTILFNDEEHEHAKAAAAIIKHYKKRNLPITARFSVEGQSLEKNGSLIQRSVARSVALTIKPANASCDTAILSEITKSERQVYDKIVKNEIDGPITKDLLVIDPSQIMSSLDQLSSKLSELKKALEAGVATAGPGSLSGGASLQGKPPAKKTEATKNSPKEETSEKTEVSLQSPNKKKLEAVNEKAKDLEPEEIKLKKAEIFILKNLSLLKKQNGKI